MKEQEFKTVRSRVTEFFATYPGAYKTREVADYLDLPHDIVRGVCQAMIVTGKLNYTAGLKVAPSAKFAKVVKELDQEYKEQLRNRQQGSLESRLG